MSPNPALSVLVLAPAALLPTLGQAMERLGVAHHLHDPSNAPQAWENPFGLVLVLLTPENEDHMDAYEDVLYAPGVDTLFDEGEGREAWNAAQWESHWGAKVKEAQAKHASRLPATPEEGDEWAEVSVQQSLGEAANLSQAPDDLPAPLGMDDEWGSMVFPVEPVPAAERVEEPLPLVPTPPPAVQSPPPSAAEPEAEEELSLADSDSVWASPPPAPRAALDMDLTGLYLEGEESPESAQEASEEPEPQPEPQVVLPTPWVGLVAVLGGTGGPAALRELLNALPGKLCSPVVIFQDLPQGRHDVLAKTLARSAQMPVTTPEVGEVLQQGHAYVLNGQQAIQPSQGGPFEVTPGTPDELLLETGKARGVVILLSGAPAHWLLPAMEAMGMGALFLGQEPDTAYDGQFLRTMADVGLVTADFSTLASHVSEYLESPPPSLSA